MPPKPRAAPPAPVSVWERPEPPRRPAPSPLSRDKIVRAAIKLADKDGLAAVSLRNVGAALDAGPMRLYGYVDTKEELLDLMADAVYGELLAEGPIRGDWRRAMRTVAHRTRAAADRHPWFVELLGGRPNQGPNSLAYLEAGLAAVAAARGFERIDLVLRAFGAVHAYVIGAIRVAATDAAALRASGQSEAEWQLASWPHLARVLATGQFPTIARVVEEATHPADDVVFERGLDLVLDGIAAALR